MEQVGRGRLAGAEAEVRVFARRTRSGYLRLMPRIRHLLEKNRAWAAEHLARDPDFFRRLADQQAPEYLWIGCSDSRVPANEIVGLNPGEMFVHRNVANLVVHADLNCLSTIQYAVDVLRVRHVIVAGHYRCGGVLAALRDDRLGLSDNWLRHLQAVRWKHHDELESLPGEVERHARLCELNVIQQVIHVAQTTVLRDAWGRGQEVAVHGLIYDVADGLLRDLGVRITGEHEIPAGAVTPSRLPTEPVTDRSGAP